jgi:hypothetical protein
MNSIRMDDPELNQPMGEDRESGEKFVDAREFRDLMVSHRRLVRVDKTDELVRGLRDLDTGEIFLIDERRLFEQRR